MSEQAMLIPKIRKGPRCTVGQLLDVLPDEEAVALDHMLGSQMLATDIAALVLADGYADIAGPTFARHRRGACSCGRFPA